MEPDQEMQFGQLVQPKLPVAQRPDQQPECAVRPFGTLVADDLPIFIDFDVLLEMMQHASSNVRVELGGVLLGGQYLDSHGHPFVVISHALRAEHYQATRGSFKFTHETWEAITRQRANFPQETQMVGWYHTHPDWGVFLSSMDRFICEHFFDKPLDVAIVLDPIREERGIFTWDQSAERRMNQVSGFYLYSQRRNSEELQKAMVPWGTELVFSAPNRSPSDQESTGEDTNPPGHDNMPLRPGS
jgi:proteasome lid subunit RPN8/RPN11